MTALLLVAVLAVALPLRLAPLRVAGPGWGGDRWYWRAYVDELRRERRFPPRLPRYLLDEGHWYPPVFPLLLAALPEAWLRRYDALTAVAVDLLRLVLLLVAAPRLGVEGVLALGAAGIAYATAPVLVSYNAQLNPRGLGALLLDVGILCFWTWWQGASSAWLAAAVACGAAVLLTHKMTTQLMLFLAIGAAALARSPAPLFAVAGAAALAWLASAGFYGRVLRAHWDIVRFWNRHWRWLFSHPLGSSPVYGDDGTGAPAGLHARGWRSVARRALGLVAMGPAAWLVALLGAALLGSHGATDPAALPVLWTLLVLLFATATTFVPWMRCLGAGYLYLYNAALPAALAWGVLATAGTDRRLVLAWCAAQVAACLAIGAFLRRLGGLAGGEAESSREGLFDRLRQLPPGRVLCVPQKITDALAYQTPQSVVWGGHGYGFRRLEPLFPRWMIRLDRALADYAVDYLVVEDRGDVPDTFERDLGALPEPERFGAYRLYRVRGEAPPS